jgi:hypothetical protein
MFIGTQVTMQQRKMQALRMLAKQGKLKQLTAVFALKGSRPR